jgi:protein-disulfide isomerase
MKKTIKWEIVFTAVLGVCAVTTTGLVVRHEFMPTPAVATSPGVTKPVFIQGWKSQFAFAERIGPASAPAQLIEFADFECPFCASFHKVLRTVRERYPTQVALVYVHFPLQMHRFAVPAARVAECAGEQGHFESMHDKLFEGQEDFGLKPWTDFAIAAGVPDIGRFNACIKGSDPIPRVEEGKNLGTQLDVQGTPTLVINGWKLGRPPTEQELDAMVNAVFAGKDPVSKAPQS